MPKASKFSMKDIQRSVVLFSGGLDSTTCLAMACRDSDEVYALSFDYGQRHAVELLCAEKIVKTMKVCEHKVIRIDSAYLQGSALTDRSIDVPDYDQAHDAQIPVTYVPARNTLFLSYALGWAEVVRASRIYIGVNAVDYSGYPDCRPEFIAAFQKMATLATKFGVEKFGVEAVTGIDTHPITIVTPLIHFSKQQIILAGQALALDYRLTVSCYSADQHGRACGKCDSCHYRREGFIKAGREDATLYYT